MNILITTTSAFASISLIKIFKRAPNNIRLFACDSGIYEMNSANQFVDVFFQSPTLDDPISYIKFLNIKCQEHNIDLVISVMDDEIRVFAKHKNLIQFNIVIPENNIIELFHNKESASIAMNDIGIHIPPILTDLRGKSKVIFRKKTSIGSKGIYIADLTNLPYIENHFSSDVFIQQYIEGEEYTVDILADKNGTIHMIIPRKRITILNGLSYRCQLTNQTQLIELCKKIYAQYCIPGLSNVQFILKDNIPYFIELNTRFAATGIAGILGSFNYLNSFLDHFVLGKDIPPIETLMNCIAWNSIITRYFEETIYIGNKS